MGYFLSCGSKRWFYQWSIRIKLGIQNNAHIFSFFRMVIHMARMTKPNYFQRLSVIFVMSRGLIASAFNPWLTLNFSTGNMKPNNIVGSFFDWIFFSPFFLRFISCNSKIFFFHLFLIPFFSNFLGTRSFALNIAFFIPFQPMFSLINFLINERFFRIIFCPFSIYRIDTLLARFSDCSPIFSEKKFVNWFIYPALIAQ